MKIALFALAATVAVAGLAGTAEARPHHHRPVFHHHVRHVYHHPVHHRHYVVHHRHH